MGLLGTRYSIVERLGQGEEGVVERCRDEQLGIDVAVKVVRDKKQARRQWRHLHAAKGRGLVGVIGYHEEPSHALIVMDLVKGTTYEEWLSGGPPPRVRLRQLLSIVRVLQRLHRAKIAHGDGMPWNIMVTPAGEAVFIDPRAGGLNSLERGLDEELLRELVSATFRHGDEADEVRALTAAIRGKDGQALARGEDAIIGLLANPNVFSARNLPALTARAEEQRLVAIEDGAERVRQRHIAIRALKDDIFALHAASLKSPFELELTIDPDSIEEREQRELARFGPAKLPELDYQEVKVASDTLKSSVVATVLGHAAFRPPWPRELGAAVGNGSVHVKIGARSATCRIHYPALSGAMLWEIETAPEGIRPGCLDNAWYRWVYQLLIGLIDFGDLGQPEPEQLNRAPR